MGKQHNLSCDCPMSCLHVKKNGLSLPSQQIKFSLSRKEGRGNCPKVSKREGRHVDAKLCKELHLSSKMLVKKPFKPLYVRRGGIFNFLGAGGKDIFWMVCNDGLHITPWPWFHKRIFYCSKSLIVN